MWECIVWYKEGEVCREMITAADADGASSIVIPHALPDAMYPPFLENATALTLKAWPLSNATCFMVRVSQTRTVSSWLLSRQCMR